MTSEVLTETFEAERSKRSDSPRSEAELSRQPDPEAAEWVSTVNHATGRCLSRLGQRGKALERFTAAVRLSTQEPERTREAYEEVSRIHVALGNKAAALEAQQKAEEFRKAVEPSPNDEAGRSAKE